MDDLTPAGLLPAAPSPVAAFPLTPPSDDHSGPWGISAADAADVQGLAVSPFAHLQHALAVFLRLSQGGGAWLQALLDAHLLPAPAETGPGSAAGSFNDGDGGGRSSFAGSAFITPAAGRTEPCAAIALAWSGLHQMGLPGAALDTFSGPFREGMTSVSRRRRLGDKGDALYQEKMRWSGNVAPLRQALSAPSEAAAEEGPVKTEDTVHALLLLYDRTASTLETRAAQVLALLAPHGAAPVFTLPLTLKPFGHGSDIPREHFGFADGFSQPLPEWDEARRDELHGVPVGEVLMGHTDAHGDPAPGPTAADSPTSRGILSRSGQAAAQANLGRNGSYMVVRQLHQDVAAFRGSMAKSAAALDDPSITAEWMAEKVIGRRRDGDLLLPGGSLPAVAGKPDNNFGYFAKDRYGHGCPIGAHVRRANPRDGLARDESARDSMRTAANNHRILRRARKYGEPLPEGAPDDGAERGLLFMCLQTDIARQFEFVQQTWLLNRVFGTLMDETDPLLGPAGPFTLPADPLRRMAQVKTFVRLVGGEYFFLPSLSALRYLGTLPEQPA